MMDIKKLQELTKGMSIFEKMNAIKEAENDVYRVNLLKEFYSSMRTDKAKVILTNDNDTAQKFMQYFSVDKIRGGEVTGDRPKERMIQYEHTFENIKKDILEKLLLRHLWEELNVCLYFDQKKNNVCCFNIDINKAMIEKADDPTKKVLKTAALETCIEIVTILKRFDMIPLFYASGHGYHIWLRFAEPIDNERLRKFMSDIEWLTIYAYKIDLTKAELEKYVKYRPWVLLYPRIENITERSLRLFGTAHVGTGEFTEIWKGEYGLTALNKEESWEYFEWYMKNRTISREQFDTTLKRLIDFFSRIDDPKKQIS